MSKARAVCSCGPEARTRCGTGRHILTCTRHLHFFGSARRTANMSGGRNSSGVNELIPNNLHSLGTWVVESLVAACCVGLSIRNLRTGHSRNLNFAIDIHLVLVKSGAQDLFPARQESW